MGQLYTMTGSGLEEMQQRKELPINTLVYYFGAGMSETTGAVIEQANSSGKQKCVSLSTYEPRFFSIDEYSRPVSKKFGIGVYYSDPVELVPEDEVKQAIQRATESTEERRVAAEAQKAADEKERAELPAMYPHLTPGEKAIENLRVDLKKNFPGMKFSVAKHGSYDTANISWTDGPTVKEVEAVSGKYCGYSSDQSGDFCDYTPSNFNRVFGSAKYVFESRLMSEKTKAVLLPIAQELYEKHPYDCHNAENFLYRIYYQCSFPLGAVATGIKRNTKESGLSDPSTFYEIEFLAPETVKPEKTAAITAPAQAGKVQIISYSEKAIAVIGDTFPIKDKLKELGGRFNRFLSCGPGWVFPKTSLENLKNSLS